ncbi:hypothetical protein [Pseudotamlana agarivorans]|uniref:hypothetical protein n=1 Tax=Pseudotamlana agarivorans TaxID=481183 RepID=UPI00082C17EF|nr:hypothetical protein [Tamlana agarivorans]
MKHLFKLKRIVLITVFGFLAFNCSKDDSENSGNTSFYKPDGVITINEAQDLHQAWQDKNAALFNKAGSSKFSEQHQSFWWSLEDIRNYLDYAQQEAKDKGYNMNGIRVYLAAYPEKEGQNTLFIAPTGYENTVKASVLNLSFFGNDEDIPVGPLNRSAGGSGGYNP